MKYRVLQFLDNYRIYKERKIDYKNHGDMYERGDFKFALFEALVYAIPAVIFFVVFCLVVFNM